VKTLIFEHIIGRNVQNFACYVASTVIYQRNRQEISHLF
jgi:hypothetical protein